MPDTEGEVTITPAQLSRVARAADEAEGERGQADQIRVIAADSSNDLSAPERQMMVNAADSLDGAT